MRSLPVLESAERATLEILPDGRIHGWHGLLFKLELSPCLMPKHKCSSCPASAYVSVETQFRDGHVLAAALREMGYVIEEHDVAKALYGYKGDQRPQVANIIIRAPYVGGAANDVGFERMTDGSYRAHVSEYDRGHNFTEAQMKELKHRYAKALVIKTAKAKGYSVASAESKDGKVKLVLRRFS